MKGDMLDIVLIEHVNRRQQEKTESSSLEKLKALLWLHGHPTVRFSFVLMIRCGDRVLHFRTRDDCWARVQIDGRTLNTYVHRHSTTQTPGRGIKKAAAQGASEHLTRTGLSRILNIACLSLKIGRWALLPQVPYPMISF